MSKAVTEASSVIFTDDIIKSPEKRFCKVKEERASRIKQWKKGLSDLTQDASDRIDEYLEQIDELEDEIMREENVAENRKKIRKLKEKINKLNRDKYTNKDLARKQREIFQDIMTECEGKICPFCGGNFGSEQGVKSHLSEKSDGLNDKELKKMNKVSERSTNYARNYKKEFGTNKFDVQVPLEQFNNETIKVEIGEEIHHLISIDPYASTLRISRIGNLIDCSVNSNPNLTSVPSVEAKAFQKAHGLPFSQLPEKDKFKIAEAAIEESEMQLHQGGHGFKPAKNLPSYEKKLVQDMSEIEQEVLEMSKNGCLGQTKDGREQVKNLVKKRLEELQKRIKSDITNFKPSEDGKPKVQRFLAQVDFDYHTGKGK